MNTDVLDPSLHSKECNYLRYLFDKCKDLHPLGRVAGKCSYWWIAICECTKQERLYRRDRNLEESRKLYYNKPERPVRLPRDRYTPALQRLEMAGFLEHLEWQPQDRYYYPPNGDENEPMPWYKASGPRPENAPKYQEY